MTSGDTPREPRGFTWENIVCDHETKLAAAREEIARQLTPPPLIVICNGVEYMRIEPSPSGTEMARGIDVVPAEQLRGAVEALRRAHDLLDLEQGHTTETWADREHWSAP